MAKARGFTAAFDKSHTTKATSEICPLLSVWIQSKLVGFVANHMETAPKKMYVLTVPPNNYSTIVPVCQYSPRLTPAYGGGRMRRGKRCSIASCGVMLAPFCDSSDFLLRFSVIVAFCVFCQSALAFCKPCFPERSILFTFCVASGMARLATITRIICQKDFLLSVRSPSPTQKDSVYKRVKDENCSHHLLTTQANA